MFKQISTTIALRFMAFVFLLLLLNGLLFLVADFSNARRQANYRLVRMSQIVEEDLMTSGSLELRPVLPPMLRDRIRVLDAEHVALYAGDIFDGVPLPRETGFSSVWIQNEQFVVLTTPLVSDGVVQGYIQVADVERLPYGEIPLRALLYLIVSGAISAVTFSVGKYFAKSSLRPAEEMVVRLEQFTQDASHELRTPLAAMSSSLDLAIKTKQYHEGILSAKEDLRAVAQLVERLLELTRLDQFVLEKQDIDFSELVTDSVEKHRPLADEQGVRITTKIQPGVHVRGDASLLRQVVVNLLSNAVKFRKDKGHAEVAVELTSGELVVSDNGVGIDPEHLPHIFDRFYQADGSRAHGGFGLGLALVKRIVELHDWTIGASGAPGEGATFAVRLIGATQKSA